MQKSNREQSLDAVDDGIYTNGYMRRSHAGVGSRARTGWGGAGAAFRRQRSRRGPAVTARKRRARAIQHQADTPPPDLKSRMMHGAGAALATTDGRWAVVQSGLLALVAGAIAWMAVGTLPVSHPMTAPGRSSLPYALFMKLIRAGEPQGPQGDNSDNANPNPGVESRTVTLDRGDTLAGMLEDVGISPQDANAVIAAMGKDFNPHALKAGQSFRPHLFRGHHRRHRCAAQTGGAADHGRDGQPQAGDGAGGTESPTPATAKKPANPSRACCRCISRPPSTRTSPSPAPPTAPTPPTSRKRNCRYITTAPAAPSIPAFIWRRCRRAFPPKSSSI